MQTRRQEISDAEALAELSEDQRRLLLRQRIKVQNTDLASTHAEEKLRRDQVQGKDVANDVHYQAGVVVRRAIAELGDTMPEDLPTVDSIKKRASAEKKRLAAPKKTRRTMSP